MTVYNQAVYNSLWGFERNGDVSPVDHHNGFIVRNCELRIFFQ